MSFNRRMAVVGCCIRLHNYCINERVELDEQVRTENGVIEVIPGLSVMAPFLNDNGVPVENLHSDCNCETCIKGLKDKTKADNSRRIELENILKDVGLVRPYRRRH